MNSTKTKKVKKINDKTVIAALDIGKNVHYGYFRAPNGNDVKPFPFFNSKKSYHAFWGKLCQFKNQQGLEEIVIGFESTGPYAEPLFHFLRKKPVKLVQVNPLHTKRVKELTGNSPNKTDKKDPRVIADVICLGHALTLVVPQGPAAQLRRLAHARERSIKKRTADLNQLQDLMYVIFPEFSGIMKDISTKTARHLARNYPSPEAIVQIGIEPLAAMMKMVSRGKISMGRAKALFHAACHSIGIVEGKEAILIEIEHLISRIETEDEFVKNIENQMRKQLEHIPYVDSILSIKGIGHVTAAGLIGEVGDFSKFTTLSEIMKLAGLDLYEISSGRHKGQRRISKRGRPLMRKLLFYAAINAVKSKGIMHKKYHQMLDRGMLKMKALVAISRKLLGLIFAIVRDKTKYVENYSDNHHYKIAA
jgi:transposase